MSIAEFVLKHPKAYRRFQNALQKNEKGRFYVTLASCLTEHFSDRPIIDVGCGDAAFATYLPAETNYTGIDLSDKYIANAQQKFPHFNFRAEDITQDLSFVQDNSVFLFLGVVHHIDDDSVRKIMSRIKSLNNATIICIDCVKLKKQNPIARLMVNLDRGDYVRFDAGYYDVLDGFKFYLRDDLIRLPYNHIISVYNIDATIADGYFSGTPF